MYTHAGAKSNSKAYLGGKQSRGVRFDAAGGARSHAKFKTIKRKALQDGKLTTIDPLTQLAVVITPGPS
jgi:hypothetical protein